MDCLVDARELHAGLTTYPPTRGGLALREAIAHWLHKRYAVEVDPATSVLPVNGTREGLFSFGQAMLNGGSESFALMPNPFYQIYEGAAFLRGTQPYYVPSTERPEFEEVPESIWAQTELV